VAGSLDVALDEHGTVAEGRCASDYGRARTHHSRLRGSSHDPHAPAAAPHRCLDDERIARGPTNASAVLEVGHRISRAGHDRDPGLDRQGLRPAVLSPSARKTSAAVRRTRSRRPRKPGRSRPARTGTRSPGGSHRRCCRLAISTMSVDVEYAATGLLPTSDQIGLVGLVAVQVDAILVAEDGDGTDAELGGGSKHADRDLPAVGTHQLANSASRRHAGAAYQISATSTFTAALGCPAGSQNVPSGISTLTGGDGSATHRSRTLSCCRWSSRS
jgi:hypothetical protein